MNIAIEARALSGSGGVATYTRQLIRHLLRLTTGDEWWVLYDQVFQTSFDKAHAVVVPLSHEALVVPWLNWSVPRALRKIPLQVVHFTKAAVPRQKIAPTVVTIYDVIPLLFPQSQRLLQRYYWPTALQSAAARADRILTISQASKRDIVHHLKVAPEKIVVTPLAADRDQFYQRTAPEIAHALKAHQLASPYLLCVSTWEPRKNIQSLLRIFERIASLIPHTLVLVGRQDYQSAKTVQYLRTSTIASRVRVLSYVSPAELPALYSGADLFVWPSVYEGWGLPVLEALACGAKVLVSNGGALPEVVGDAGGVVSFTTENLPERTRDNTFEEAFATQLLAVLSIPRDDAQRAASIAQAAKFSWEDVARVTRGVYDQVQ